MRRHLLVPLLVAGSLVAAACGGTDDTAGPTPTPTPADADPTPTARPTAAPEPPSAASADPLAVETSLGPVRGTAEGNMRAFRAIPYAAPPVGDNRWRRPRAHTGWSTPLQVTDPGSSCPQPTDGITAAFTLIPPSDEDCLTLSVFTPTDAAELPVMVWFHGGGFTDGSAHQPLYDGVDLASEGVVVVAVNYRLGALGFLATDALRADSPAGTVGNLGIADQIEALRWVEENATGFGGDPDNVTVFGESAGGFSVCAHLSAAASRPLYDKAIIQSGGGCQSLTDIDTAFARGEELVAEMGCAETSDQVSCLRELSVDEIIAAGSDGLGLIADGDLLIESALARARAGQLTGTPVLAGSNTHEARLFTFAMSEPSDEDLRNLVAGLGVPDPDAALELVPPAEFGSNLARFQTLSTDLTFSCPSLTFTGALGDRGGDAFAYEFGHESAADPFGLGATHGAELPFVFRTPDGIVGVGAFDQSDESVSDFIQRTWVAFAASGDPSTDLLSWSTTSTSDPSIAELGLAPTVADVIRDGRCDALAAQGATP